MRGLVVDDARCFGCRACATACPPARIGLWEADGVRYVRFPGVCQEDCTRCQEVCPREAISFEEVGAERAGRELRFVLHPCDRCGRPFAPEPMLADLRPRVNQAMATTESPWLNLCLSCRREEVAAGLLDAL